MATDTTPKTLREAILFFAVYENCRKAVEAIRWPDGVVRCPTCESEHVTYLATQRRYKCYGKHSKAQFSLKFGTIFEDSAVGLEKWLPALWLLTNCKNGISSYELARALGVTQKTAWFMLVRLRLALLDGVPADKLRGQIECDSMLHTDAFSSYDGLHGEYIHKVIDHAERYVDGEVHTNSMENFWSLLKRAIKGTYVSIEPFHLFRYLDEQAFRFNNRKMTDSLRFALALKGIIDKRLTYTALTGSELPQTC